MAKGKNAIELASEGEVADVLLKVKLLNLVSYPLLLLKRSVLRKMTMNY